MGLLIGYIGSKRTYLQMYLNQNQPLNGVRPFPTLSGNSPIDPGTNLNNLHTSTSVGNSNYNALWATVTRHFSKGLQLSTSYTWSKSLDYNSHNLASSGYGTPQNSLNPREDYGPSDFDVRDRWVISGVYALPFQGNLAVEGWQLSVLASTQTGNSFSVHTTLANNGIAGLTRPNILGPVPTSESLASNGNIQYIPRAFCNTPTHRLRLFKSRRRLRRQGKKRPLRARL